MSVYIDIITFAWAVWLLFVYADWSVKGKSWVALLGFSAASFYTLAQSGWTTAFFLGDEWGRDFSNYLWFIFNSTVFALLTYLWYGKR